MPLVTYSVLRLGLLAACFGLGYLAGLRTWLLLGLAVLGAWGLSYVLLAGPRDAAAAYVAQRVERRGRAGGSVAGVDEDAAHEDALVERARRRGEPGAGEADGPPTRPHRGDYPDETASPSPNSTP